MISFSEAAKHLWLMWGLFTTQTRTGFSFSTPKLWKPNRLFVQPAMLLLVWLLSVPGTVTITATDLIGNVLCIVHQRAAAKLFLTSNTAHLYDIISITIQCIYTLILRETFKYMDFTLQFTQPNPTYNYYPQFLALFTTMQSMNCSWPCWHSLFKLKAWPLVLNNNATLYGLVTETAAVVWTQYNLNRHHLLTNKRGLRHKIPIP